MARANQAVATADDKSTAAAVYDYGADAGLGYEGFSSSDYSIPYLSVLQGLSPQVTDNNPAGARPGMIYNTVTGELIDGNEGVVFQCAELHKKYVEWVPRDAGGGLVAIFDPSDPEVSEAINYSASKNLKYGKLETPAGNSLIETYYAYGLIHDGSSDVVAAFPDSNGSGTARVLKRCAKTENNGWGMNTTAADFAHLPDAGTGSAARFFYCAKASKKDRGDGNGHPTVKPTDLMAYLCRLVTPPGGAVLDPFMGSGSTGKAAVREGFHFIGVECEPAYFDIAFRRIEQAHAQGQLFEPTQAAPVQLGLEAA